MAAAHKTFLDMARAMAKAMARTTAKDTKDMGKGKDKAMAQAGCVLVPKCLFSKMRDS